MANIHQEQPSIRNMQVVSSNRFHSTHSCEAIKCRIFKPFFLEFTSNFFIYILTAIYHLEAVLYSKQTGGYALSPETKNVAVSFKGAE